MKSRGLFIPIALMALAAPVLAWAALGENAASVQADQTRMKATTRIAVSGDKYTVHEIKTPAGTTVREFVAPGGTVFAVAWKGPVITDLRQLLGQYFEPYANGKRAERRGHGLLTIHEPGLVVHSRGRMRAFSGRAYIPDILPPGVTVDEIQ